MLKISPIKTPIFEPDSAANESSLSEFIANHLPSDLIQEGMVLAVSSKIVSLSEHRTIPKSGIDKARLIDQEADLNLGPIGYGSILTIKENLLLPSAGVDESNSKDESYILLPKNPFLSAERLHKKLAFILKLKNFGVLLTDSRTSPLRFGVTGVSIAHWGFCGLKSKVGANDLFGRPLRMTQINIADALAAAAVLTMGESDESSPLAVIQGATVEFTVTTDPQELRPTIENDMYFELYKDRLKSRSDR